MTPLLTLEGVVIDPVMGRLTVAPYNMTNVVRVSAFVHQAQFRKAWSDEALSTVTYVTINGVMYEPVKWVNPTAASWFTISEFQGSLEMRLDMLLRQV